MLQSYFGGADFLNFCLFVKVLSSLNLSEIIAGWNNTTGKFSPFITLSISCHTLLAYSVSSEISAVNLMGIPSLFVALPFLLLIFSLFAKFFLIWLIYALACFSFGLPCVGLCASWTWVCFLQQYREIFFHCFFKWDFIFLSLFSLNPYNVNVSMLDIIHQMP